MAKKDNENFDFDTEEGKGKFSFDLSFLKNLTKQQKGIILIAAVAVVLVIAIVVTCIALGANSNNGGGNNNPGGNNQGGVGSDDVETMYISSQPTKQVYYVGEQPDYSGLIVCINTVNAGTCFETYDANPELFTFSGFDSSVPNEELKVTLEYKGKSLSFNLKILETPEVPPVLQSIRLDPMPQTEYSVGDVFRAKGAKIIATYSDGTTQAISLMISHLSGFGAAVQTPGEHEIKVGYFDDFGGYAETSFTITVTE